MTLESRPYPAVAALPSLEARLMQSKSPMWCSYWRQCRLWRPGALRRRRAARSTDAADRPTRP